MALKIYNPENANKNTLFLRLIEADDGRINLVAVDGVTGKHDNGAHILGITNNGVILYNNLDTNLGITLDRSGEVLLLSEEEEL